MTVTVAIASAQLAPPPTPPTVRELLEKDKNNIESARSAVQETMRKAESDLKEETAKLSSFKTTKSDCNEIRSYEELLRSGKCDDMRLTLDRVAQLRLDVDACEQKLKGQTTAIKQAEQAIWYIDQAQKMKDVRAKDDLDPAKAKIEAATKLRKELEPVEQTQDIGAEKEKVFNDYFVPGLELQKKTTKRIEPEPKVRDSEPETTNKADANPNNEMDVEEAKEAFLAQIKAYNDRNEVGYWDVFAPKLECFYNRPDAEISYFHDVRMAQFRVGGRKQTIEKIKFHKRERNRIAFKIRGILDRGDADAVRFYKLIVLESMQQGWKIVVEADAEYNACARGWWN